MSVPQLTVALALQEPWSVPLIVFVSALCFAFDLHTLIEGQLLKACLLLTPKGQPCHLHFTDGSPCS